MRYLNYREFFTEYGDGYVKVEFMGWQSSVSVEEMYQHFKARLLDEMKDIKSEDSQSLD